MNETVVTPIPNADGSSGAFGFAAYVRSSAMEAGDAEMIASKFESLGREIRDLKQRAKVDVVEKMVDEACAAWYHQPKFRSLPGSFSRGRMKEALAAAFEVQRKYDIGMAESVPHADQITSFLHSYNHLKTLAGSVKMFDAATRPGGDMLAELLADEDFSTSVQQVVLWLQKLSGLPELTFASPNNPETLQDTPFNKSTPPVDVPSGAQPIENNPPQGHLVVADVDGVFTWNSQVQDSDQVVSLNATIGQQKQEIAHLKRIIWSELFQTRVAAWMQPCFGPEIAADNVELRHRFQEESVETTQAAGAPREEWDRVLDYVYGRAAGDLKQEFGGVSIALAAFASSYGFNLHMLAETELEQCWLRMDEIRAKRLTKPKFDTLISSPQTRDHILSVDNAMIKAARENFAKSQSWALAIGAALQVKATQSNRR